MALKLIDKGIDSAGTVHPKLTDNAGRTKISHGQPDATVGVINALNSQLAVPSDGFSDAIFYFDPAGSHVVTFEQSPNSTDGLDGLWFPALAQNQGAVAASATSTGTMTTTDSSWRLSAPAGVWIRARVSTFTTTGDINVWATTTTAAAQPQLSAVVTGSVTATVASTVINPSATATGVTLFRNIAVNTTDVTVKTTAGRLYTYNIHNSGAVDTYVQFYNALIASVTVGTTVPVWTVTVPAGESVTLALAYPLPFATAITVAATTTFDGLNAAAVVAPVSVELGYI